MLVRIRPELGAQLMREWGIPEWPEDVPDAEYWHFEGRGVFCIHPNEEGGIDGHMAMCPGFRHHSRRMCREFIEKWGHLPIRVPIEISRRHVKNVVLKMGGFVESEPQEVPLIDGTTATVFFLRRLPYGQRN